MQTSKIQTKSGQKTQKACYPQKINCLAYNPKNQGCLKCDLPWLFGLSHLADNGANYCVLYWYWLAGLVLVGLGVLAGLLWGFENYHKLRERLELRFDAGKHGDLEENGVLIEAGNEVVPGQNGIGVEPEQRGEGNGLVAEGEI
jgi:hypothetical protein